jgi:hypothetical protein
LLYFEQIEAASEPIPVSVKPVECQKTGGAFLNNIGELDAVSSGFCILLE